MSAKDLLLQLAKTRQQLQSAQMRVAELEALLYAAQSPPVNSLTSPHHYSHIFDHLLEGAEIIGFDWRYLYVNDAVAGHGRQTKDVLLRSTVIELYPGIENTNLFAFLRTCMEERTAQHFESEFVFPDGTTAWFELSVQPIPEGIFILSLEITERKQAEKALKRYAQRMEILHEIDHGLIQGGSIETLVEITLQRIREIIPCQRANVGVIDHATGEGLIFAVDFAGHTLLGKGVRVPLPPDFFEGYDERHLKVVEDFHLFEDSNPRIKQALKEGLVCGMNVLLMDQERPIGTLGLMADTTGFFNTEYQDIALEIANQLALALRHLHLSEVLERHAALLEQRVEERTAELQAAKERVEAILNNSVDGIVLVHTDLSIQQTNVAFNRLFACESDHYFNQSLRVLMQADDVERVTTTMQLGAVDKEETTLEIRAQREDGTLFDAELSVGFIQDGGCVCTVRDISQRKAQERQLRLYASLQQNVSDAVISTDMQFRIQSWNQAAARIYGWSEEEAKGKSATEILQTRYSSAEARQAIVQQLHEQGWWQGEILQQHKDGTAVYAFGSVTLIKDESGVPLGIVSINRDITERKKAEQILKAKQAEEEEFQTYLKALHHITIELTQIEHIDQFYKRAVELGLEQLGFERLALFLYDKDKFVANGTYGTDQLGNLTDERHLQFSPNPKGILLRALQRIEMFCFDEATPLYQNREQIGFGWNAAAVLWNGGESLGWLVADNAISQQPASKPLLDILSLYALTLGTLLAQKRGEVALRESEEKFRQLLDAAPIATIIADQTGRITLVNIQAETLFGYERAEIMGQMVEELIPDRIHDKHIHDRSEYAAAPHIRQMDMDLGLELFAKRKDASEFPVEIQLSYIQTKQGMMVMSFVEDVSERKRIAAELERQRTFLQQVIDVSPSMIFVKDYDSRFILVNPMVAKMHNTTVEALIGKTNADINASLSEVEAFIEADRRVITSGEPFFIEEPLTTPGGETRWLQTTKVPIVSMDGKSTYVLGVATDITERKKSEEALRQALAKEKELGELKSRFVSMASHEFRTPLATILVVAETLMAYRHKLTDEQIEQRLSKIQDQVAHLKDIMDDVLFLARMQARRVEFQPVKLNLDDLYRSVIDEFQYQPDLNDKFLYSCDEQLHEIILDKKLMRQIINNLVSNAVKYSPHDKKIVVSLALESDHLIFKVQDEGIGIPEADLKHLFEPFHRATNVGTISGTGLGLVITKESVELHGGTISVESQIGKGTTFTVNIPLKQEKENGNDKNFDY